MKKASLFTLALMIFSLNSFSTEPVESKSPQNPLRRSSIEFMHSGGVAFMSVFDKSASISGWAAGYTPRVSMVTSKYSAFGLSAPVIFGFSLSSSEGSSLLMDLPLTVEYSFGYGATEKAYRRSFGMFFGAGAGVSVISAGYGVGGSFSHADIYIRVRALRLRKIRSIYGWDMHSVWATGVE